MWRYRNNAKPGYLHQAASSNWSSVQQCPRFHKVLSALRPPTPPHRLDRRTLMIQKSLPTFSWFDPYSSQSYITVHTILLPDETDHWGQTLNESVVLLSLFDIGD